MAVEADWIKIELGAADQANAEKIAQARHKRRRGTSKEWGRAGLAGHRAGAYGEVATGLYLGLPVLDSPHPDDLDVGPYYVSTGEKAHHQLNIARLGKIRSGRYLFALAHEIPGVVWLVGEMHSDEGERKGAWTETWGSRWFAVHPRHLHPLPERNGYTRGGNGIVLVDPQTPFWCEECGHMHPIIEHRQCRDNHL